MYIYIYIHIGCLIYAQHTNQLNHVLANLLTNPLLIHELSTPNPLTNPLPNPYI